MNTGQIVAVVSHIASVLSAVVALAVALHTNRKAKHQTRWTLRDNYDRLGHELSVFWDGLRHAYSLFREQRADELPEDLMQFLDSCGMPPGLREVDNIKLYELKAGTPDQEALYDFASKVYPLGTKTREQLISESIVEDSVANQFFDSRNKLGGFWHNWSRRVPIKHLCAEYQTERGLLIALTWLDITHRKWTGEDHRGKIGMYRLAYELISRHKRH